MLARIFRPARTAMQSGRGNTELWVLEYEPEVPLKVDPLMGYNSSTDMRRQIRLEFSTSAEAVAYAERNHIPFRLLRGTGPGAEKAVLFDEQLPLRPPAALDPLTTP
jgi:hypothetical protein